MLAVLDPVDEPAVEDSVLDDAPSTEGDAAVEPVQAIGDEIALTDAEVVSCEEQTTPKGRRYLAIVLESDGARYETQAHGAVRDGIGKAEKGSRLNAVLRQANGRNGDYINIKEAEVVNAPGMML